MSILSRDPVCHRPGHGRYPKGSSCFKCRQLAKEKPATARPAVTEASLPTCGRCGKKIRGGYCPTPGH